jgi:myo-inositol-1(or 4)-monophosphatase
MTGEAMTDRQSIAVEVARQAGHILLDYAERGVTVEHKGRIDVVSEADRASETFLAAALRQAFPEDRFVGEEGEAVLESEVRGTGRWYVDPLDGTTNFVQGAPHWCVSLAWCSPDERIELGVVHVPATGETYVAAIGCGATLNDRVLSVHGPDRLDDALIGSGFPYDLDQDANNLAEWAAVTRRARGMRSFGAAALDLCLVSSGQLDAFWEQDLERWDIAAGALIAAEAGATVTDLHGAPLIGPANNVVAAASGIHAELLKELRSHGGSPKPESAP